MRIIRNDNEQVVSAQSNNTYYNQYNTAKAFEYDSPSEFSYSGKRFMNELARDNVYGTSNIRPVRHDRETVSRRMYKEAIEEASRVKTYGYFNEYDKAMDEFMMHESRPGKLKKQMNSDFKANTFHNQVNSKARRNSEPSMSFHNSFVDNKEDKVIQFQEIKSRKQESNEFSFDKNNFLNNSFNLKKDIQEKPLDKVNVEKKPEVNNNILSNNIMNDNMADMAYNLDVEHKTDIAYNFEEEHKTGIGYNFEEKHKTGIVYNLEAEHKTGMEQKSNMESKPDKYDDVMKKVTADLKHEIATRVVDEDKANLRSETKVEFNNIPYKKTKIFENMIYGKNDNANEVSQLKVRECKKDKKQKNKANNKTKKIGVFTWLISILFMVIPVAGFIIAGVVAFFDSEDKVYRVFVKLCLVVHMLCSLAVIYMYYNGMIDINSIISHIRNINIISNFNI